MRLERLDLPSEGRQLDWHGSPKQIVFQTPAWMSFLAQTQNAEPVVAELRSDGQTHGHFTGLVVKKLGLRILGSPFPNWSTPYMGFDFFPGADRRLAVKALIDFAFNELGCHHIEIIDRQIQFADIEGLGFFHQVNPTLEIDLTPTLDQVFENFNATCRRYVRKAESSGVVIEEAQGLDFADDYIVQLQEVFGRQKLALPWNVERVRALISHLHPTGMLLMLRARTAQGRCIATGIFPAVNESMYLWGNASYTSDQALHPNELLHWHAMKYWKRRGIKTYNMVGNSYFKQKFHGKETTALLIRKSRHRLIADVRRVAVPIALKVLALRWKMMQGRRHKEGAVVK